MTCRSRFLLRPLLARDAMYRPNMFALLSFSCSPAWMLPADTSSSCSPRLASPNAWFDVPRRSSRYCFAAANRDATLPRAVARDCSFFVSRLTIATRWESLLVLTPFHAAQMSATRSFAVAAIFDFSPVMPRIRPFPTSFIRAFIFFDGDAISSSARTPAVTAAAMTRAAPSTPDTDARRPSCRPRPASAPAPAMLPPALPTVAAMPRRPSLIAARNRAPYRATDFALMTNSPLLTRARMLSDVPVPGPVTMPPPG